MIPVIWGNNQADSQYVGVPCDLCWHYLTRMSFFRPVYLYLVMCCQWSRGWDIIINSWGFLILDSWEFMSWDCILWLHQPISTVHTLVPYVLCLYRMAALSSRTSWLSFCRVGGSEETSSVFICQGFLVSTDLILFSFCVCFLLIHNVVVV